MIRTRFAPSPNGPLHLGHAYAAIIAHDLARAAGGKFLLRIEDIDGARSRPEWAEQFTLDLAWLGLGWDGETVLQSSRLASYAQAAEKLKAMGLLYPCHCTRADIAAQAVAQGPDGPVYSGHCKGKLVEPVNAAWRLDMAKAVQLAGNLGWVDALAGEQRAQPETFGDIVLLRKDAPASYHLAATLDDAADGVTLVTRGADLFASSHIHRLLQSLLSLPVPRWHHHGLLLEPDGQKLAKRRGSASLAAMRAAGVDGLAVADQLRAHIFPTGISLASSVKVLS